MIGAYAICYRDADWLCWNIQRMYDRIDKFSVVEGPVTKYLGAELDREGIEKLNSIPDPDKKITVTIGTWEDKNEMCRVAVSKLDTEFIFQLDADEVWPEKTFEAAINLLRQGQRKIRVHMYTFFKSADYVMEAPDSLGWVARVLRANRYTVERFMRGDPAAASELRGETGQTTDIDQGQYEKLARALNVNPLIVHDRRFFVVEMFIQQRAMAEFVAAQDPKSWSPWLLDMYRVFRPCPHTRVTHIPPDLQWPNGEQAHNYAGSTLRRPIWHFSYVGSERWNRKATFFNARSGMQVMPSVDEFDAWEESQLGNDVMMTGQVRRVKRYDGLEIPEDIKAFVKEREAH